MTRALSTQTALAGDVAAALARQGALQGLLQVCAEALVLHLDAAFARVWTLDARGENLELRASAGMYTHLNGPHGWVPIGTLKIGRIASERRPHLTNEVVGDPDVSDQEWAIREGMVAFAGYPLVIEDRVVGVMALFARHALSEQTLDHLASIAMIIATGIERKRVEEALREERETLEIINEVGTLLTAELELDSLVQAVCDAATQLSGAAFGAFFYNVIDERGEAYTLYSLSGVPRSDFERFPMPRNTHIFGPTFRGEGVVRLDDVTADPRYGRNAPFHGIPEGHLPVVSYMAVPVASRAGAVLGGLFFGHPERAVFSTRSEKIVVGLSAYTAIAIDNARLFRQAQEASRLRDDFLLSISHDLKTPLAVAHGQAQLMQRRLRRNPNDTARVSEGLRIIEERIRGMTGLVDELVDVARLRVGQHLELDHRPVDVGDLLREMTAALSQTARHHLQLEVADGPFVGMWDERRINRVLDNLLNNALKYSPEGSTVTLSLTRENEDDGAWAEVRIRDEGIGIPDRDILQIFDRFYRASNAPRGVTGSGLGLAGARWIVDQHGGSIAVESREGSGSCFIVRLPLSA